MRTVKIHKSEEFDDVIRTKGNVSKMEKCLGYLCLWAFHSPRYSDLVIYCDRHGNLNATYREGPVQEDSAVTYFMYGVMCDNDGSYSTHS